MARKPNINKRQKAAVAAAKLAIADPDYPDTEIRQGIATDPDNPEITPESASRGILVDSDIKVAISLRVDSWVVDWFKAKGKGYQTNINSILRNHAYEAMLKERNGPLKDDAVREAVRVLRDVTDLLSSSVNRPQKKTSQAA